jgi:hypothetical protein
VSEGKSSRPSRRRVWSADPDPGRTGSWLALDDDDLLFRIEGLREGHQEDERLLEVVRSARHFFVRQEAAKKLSNPRALMSHAEDRHIGQILVRGLNRREDLDYLRNLVRESRHLEVRKAAEAQLRFLADRLEGS